MMDQVVSGLPQAQPASNSYRDRQQAVSDDTGNSNAFEDLVSKAGDQQPRNERRGTETDDGGAAQEKVDTRHPADTTTSKVTFDLTVALRNLSASADGRAKIANFKDALKSAEKGALPAESQDALAKLVEKLKQAAQKAEQTLQVAKDGSEAADADALVNMTPADELGLLLGLAPSKETEGRAEKKTGRANAKDDESSEKLDLPAIKTHDAKAETPDANQLAAAADTHHTKDTRTEAKSSGDDIVRVVSADGRGKAVDVSLPKVAGEPVTKDADKSGTATKVETATVLEARRYLGFTPDSNATSLANAVKADPSWTAALQAAQNTDMSALADTVKEVNTLKLQMNPENLGNMVASLKLKGDELTVDVRVDSVEAYRHLSNDHDELVKALQDQGFTIDKVTVQLNATERTDTGADRDMARQGQAQREEQGGQSNRNGGRDDGQPGWNASRDGQEASSGDGSAEPGRSGNIYL